MVNSADEFQRYVTKVADAKNGEAVLNSSAEHARIVLETMLGRAREEVLLYTGGLDSFGYGSQQSLKSTVHFLKENPHGLLTILTDIPSRADHTWHETLKNEGVADRVQLRHLPSDAKGGSSAHFLVTDGTSYRFEPDLKDGRTGIAEFGNKDRAQVMKLAFGALLARSLPVALDQATITVPLSISSIIIPSHRTTEGVLLRSTAALWDEIVAKLADNWEVAYELPPERWEELIAGAFQKEGYDEVTLTDRSGDFGRDVIAVKHGVGCIKIIGSVKAYKRGLLVPYDAVRSLVGVLAGEQNASKGIITTTSDFPPRIAKDRFIAPFMPTRLELLNWKDLKRWLAKLA